MSVLEQQAGRQTAAKRADNARQDVTLKLDSFTLEPPHRGSLEGTFAHCIEGHPHRSLTAQAGHLTIYLLAADQQLTQGLSVLRQLELARGFRMAQEAYLDVRAHQDDAVRAIALHYDSVQSETLLFVAVRTWVIVFTAKSPLATTSSASAQWRVTEVLAPSKVEGGVARSSTDQTVLSIDADGGYLAVGSRSSLSLWTCSTAMPYRWRRIWKTRTPRPVASCRLCPGQNVLAAHLVDDDTVMLWKLPKPRINEAQANRTGRRMNALRHSRSIVAMQWRREPDENGQTQVLITRTQDGVTRVWAPVIDEPDALRLISAIDTAAIGWGKAHPAIYIDAWAFGAVLRSNVDSLRRDLQVAQLGINAETTSEAEMERKQAHSLHLSSILSDTPDIVLRSSANSLLELHAISNIDRRPPTLCEKSSLLATDDCLALGIAGNAIEDAILVPYGNAMDRAYNQSSGEFIVRQSGDTVCRVPFCPASALCVSDKGSDNRANVAEALLDSNDDTGGHAEARDCTQEFVAKIGQRLTDGRPQTEVYITAKDAASITKKPEAIFTVLENDVVDFTWSIPSEVFGTPVLAIASMHSIHLIHRRRRILRADLRDAVHDDHLLGAWNIVASIDLSQFTSNSIQKIAWTQTGYLGVTTSRQHFQFSHQLISRRDAGRNSKSEPGTITLQDTIRQDDAFYADHHPRSLYEMLRWGCLDAVLTALAACEKAAEMHRLPEEDIVSWAQLDLLGRRRTRLDTRSKREISPSPAKHAASNENPHFKLRPILEIALKLEQQRALLDESAERFLVELHLATADDTDGTDGAGAPRRLNDHRISHFVWAWNSETQVQLVQNVHDMCDNRVDWPAARRAGVFLWLRSHDALCTFAEDVARAQFNSGDERDPTLCSLFYFALGKVRIVSGLWRQAIWHQDHQKMVQFLKHDFSESRWKSAALKNAFALLSQRRFAMAASFFLLGDHLSDAVNVCVRNMHDTHLAFAICRLREGRMDGPIMQRLLLDTLGPDAYRSNDRYTLSWILGLLHQEATALHIVTKPFEDVLGELVSLGFSMQGSDKVSKTRVEVCDAQLLLLHEHIANRAPHAATIDARNEGARLFRYAFGTLMRQGHGKLALALARHWHLPTPRPATAGATPSSQITGPSGGRHPAQSSGGASEMDASVVTPPKMASLMKTDKGAASQPQAAQEAAFDMGAFDF